MRYERGFAGRCAPYLFSALAGRQDAALLCLPRRAVNHPTASVGRRAPSGGGPRRPQAIEPGDARGVSGAVPVSAVGARVSAGVALRQCLQ
jgi:hypothetical protein